MGILRSFFGKGSPSAHGAGHNVVIHAPKWNPATQDERRLAAFGRRVAEHSAAAGIPVAEPGANYWIVSYDVYEAVWYPVQPGTWAAKNRRLRDGWSQGRCLLLFTDGNLAQAEWFGEVDLPKGRVKVDSVTALHLAETRWSGGNLARWRSGGGGLTPNAVEHFKGFWPPPRKPVPAWAGTSMQLKRFLEEGEGQVPRYY